MSTLTELQTLFHEKYGIEIAALTPEASMQDSGLDSLAIAEFMFAVEDHFHITLPDDDPNINTLAQLADLIDRVKAGLPPPAAVAAVPPAPNTGSVPAAGTVAMPTAGTVATSAMPSPHDAVPAAIPVPAPQAGGAAPATPTVTEDR